MSIGTSDWRDWVLDEEDGMDLVDRAIELGINFFDITGSPGLPVNCRTESGNTANMYSYCLL